MNEQSPLLVKISFFLLFVGLLLWGAAEYTKGRLAEERLVNEKLKRERKVVAKPVVVVAKPKEIISPEELAKRQFKQRHDQLESALNKKGASKVPFSTRNAAAVILVDLANNELLYGKNIDKSLPIASLTKMITVWVAMEEISNKPILKLSSRALINKEAKSQRHSKVLVNYPSKTISLQELIMSAMIKSANDSAYLLAEHVGGSAQKFMQLMNVKARSCRMNKSIFYNPHGLPGAYENPELPDNKASLKGLSHLVAELIRYPQIERWTSMKELKLPLGSKKPAMDLGNTNRLLGMRGVTGLKTGFTNNAGWCLAATRRTGKRLLLSIVLGCPSKKDRDSISRSLLIWGAKQ